MKDLFLRTKQLAIYIIQEGATVRKAGKVFGLGKSTVHYDLTKRLPFVDRELYEEVRYILNKNFKEKNIRGGIATKNKYLSKKAKEKS